MSDPLSCTSCGNPLAVESANGICPACAPSCPAGTFSIPGAAPLPDHTPNAGGDATRLEPAHDSARPPEEPGEPRGAPRQPAEREWPPAPPGYVIVNKIGRGGMGDVYLAHETLSNQFVALKYLRDPGDPALLERFAREFRALRAVAHPNAVRVLGHDFHRADPYFVMELMDGGSLAERLKTGPFEPAVAVDLIRKVAGAVQALHEYRAHENPEAGILHRDIKPDNILLNNSGDPKLADFGLAKFLDARTVHTLSGGMVGTLRYMPPEQINGQNGPLGYAADVYGLGATLYQLLTGRTPFAQDDFGALLLAVLNDVPKAPRVENPGITPGLDAVVMRCLEKDPRDRYQTVAEFLAALDRWATSDVSPPVPLRARVRKWVKRNRVALIACTLLAVAGGLGAAWPKPPSAEQLEARKLEELQAEFEDKRGVTIVRERGLPRWHNWPVGPATLGESPLQDGACSFQAIGLSMLELFRPTRESYRFRAQVQMVGADLGDPQGRAPEIGVFLGHTLYAREAGPPPRGILLLNFSDYDPEKAAGRDPKPQLLRFGWRYMLGDPGAVPGALQTPFKLSTFAAADRLPAPWWALTIDVTPDLLVARWARDGGKETVLARVTRDERLQAFKTFKIQAGIVAKRAAPPIDPGPLPNDWNPTGGLGVWCYRARIAFKNVSVSPLEP